MQRTQKISQLSVFLPAYNEEENIQSALEKVLAVLKRLKLANFEVLVVNDGSKDATDKVVTDFSKKDRHVILINHPHNLGYGAALKTGFSHAQYPWVAFTDADGQFDFSEITKLIDRSNGVDMVLGYRLNRADPFIRKVLTFGWKTLALILLGLDVKDYSCGFKLIKKQVYQEVSPLIYEEKVTQIEFLVKAQRKNFKFTEVGVHHYPRRFGKPTGGSIFSKIFWKSLADLLRLWWQLR